MVAIVNVSRTPIFGYIYYAFYRKLNYLKALKLAKKLGQILTNVTLIVSLQVLLWPLPTFRDRQFLVKAIILNNASAQLLANLGRPGERYVLGDRASPHGKTYF